MCISVLSLSIILYNSWFCHFDDDVYVNVPALVKFLEHYNGKEDKHYFGHYPNQRRGKLLKMKPSVLKAFPEHVRIHICYYTLYTLVHCLA